MAFSPTGRRRSCYSEAEAANMAAPGPRNLITDVPGILVGQAEDAAGITGTTVVVAAGGVMEALAEAGRGFAVREVRVPIVPAAILFDLGFPGRRAWRGAPPYRRLGR